jgi:hypothetical protein
VIVSDCAGTATRDGVLGRAQWRCLARRGMLHSECEAVDFVRLTAGAELAVDAAGGVEECLLVLRGRAELRTGEGPDLPLVPRQLVQLPWRTRATIRAVDEGTELLSIRGLPGELSKALPPRIPEVAAPGIAGEAW